MRLIWRFLLQRLTLPYVAILSLILLLSGSTTSTWARTPVSDFVPTRSSPAEVDIQAILAVIHVESPLPDEPFSREDGWWRTSYVDGIQSYTSNVPTMYTCPSQTMPASLGLGWSSRP